MQTKPSQHINALARGRDAVNRRPEIVELLRMADYTHNVECCVDVDDPIFQPVPAEILFSQFEGQKVYEATLRLRNNDKVRIGPTT